MQCFKRLVCGLCVILAMAAAADAQTATTTASDSPRDALIGLAKAMEAADVPALKKQLLAETKSEEQLLEQLLALATAQRDVRQAAVARFGKDSGDLTAAPRADETIRAIDIGEVTPGGNEATVRTSSGVLVVKKKDGQWKVPMSEVARGASIDLDRRLTDVVRMVAIFRQGAADIQAGKYRSADDAADGLRMKLRAAATQPATAPATPSATNG